MQETDSQSQEQATATKAASAPAKSRTLWGDAFKRLRKNKLAVIGVCWIIIVVVVALTADLWAKPWLGSPTASDSTTMAETSLMAPCAEHPFGTDALVTFSSALSTVHVFRFPSVLWPLRSPR